jgi:hypothetical protein
MLQGPQKARIVIYYLILSMTRDRPGKPPKPPLKGINNMEALF